MHTPWSLAWTVSPRPISTQHGKHSGSECCLHGHTSCSDFVRPRLPMLRQGLSDFRKAELPSLGGMLDDRCPLYRLKKDDSAPGGEGFWR